MVELPLSGTFHFVDSDRILACTNYFGTTAVTGYEYAYDLLGRPVRRNGDAFAYDTRGQVVANCYDNLGNVVAYVNESGTKVASYTYDAFGYAVSSSGSMSETFPHRFSTKWQDNYTLLYDYGYRWYWPEIGRWISRDPGGEAYSPNPYGFVQNKSTIAIDYIGLWEVSPTWPTSCGSCQVQYISEFCGGGEVALSGIELGQPVPEQCAGGMPGTISRYSIRYPDMSCIATVKFDPRIEPDTIIPGMGISYVEHELKHVHCMNSAYEWGKSQLEKLSRCCSSNLGILYDFSSQVIKGIQIKRSACSCEVDWMDYGKAEDETIRSKAETERMQAAQLQIQFVRVQMHLEELWQKIQSK